MASLGWMSKCLPLPLSVGITVHLTQKVGLALEMDADGEKRAQTTLGEI